MQLTKNFTLEEITKSSTAEQQGINNTPNDKELENIRFMAEQMQLIRNAYHQPIYITSGYRCEALNKVVGGSATSAHKEGLAVDINQGSRARNKNFFYLVKKLINVGLQVDQLINEQNFSWIHIGFKQEDWREQVFAIK